MFPGIIPILHSSGVIIPGQFGPINREFDLDNFCLTFNFSFFDAYFGFNKRLRGYNFSPRGPYNYGPGEGTIFKPVADVP